MKKYTIAIAVAASALSLNSCVPIEDPGPYQSSGNYTNHHNHHNHHIQYNNRRAQQPQQQAAYNVPLSANKGPGNVVIRQGGALVSTCYTALPNVEDVRFIKGQSQIVIKSRASHGPATVELFNSQSGTRLGTVKAYELANGGPSWAAGMAE